MFSGPDDDELLFADSSETTVKQWDVATLTREQTAFRLTDWGSSTSNLVYSADAKILVARGDQNTSWIDADTNKPIERIASSLLHPFPMAR
jgi:hypothetical protein